MIPGLSLKTSPPSPHSAGIVLVPTALSKAPVLSIKTQSPSPHSAGVLLVPAALSTWPLPKSPPPSPHNSGIHSCLGYSLVLEVPRNYSTSSYFSK